MERSSSRIGEVIAGSGGVMVGVVLLLQRERRVEEDEVK